MNYDEDWITADTYRRWHRVSASTTPPPTPAEIQRMMNEAYRRISSLNSAALPRARPKLRLIQGGKRDGGTP